MAALALNLKTKSDKVKEVMARTLQLFAQDGGENCVALKRLGMCNDSLELLSKTEDLNVQMPLAGFIYWLAQNRTLPHYNTASWSNTFTNSKM